MGYIRGSYAKHPYVCEGCGRQISVKQAYFRDEPHPMARRHRGQLPRYLCTVCVTGHPAYEFSKAMDPRQQFLPFSQALANLPPLLVQTAVITVGKATNDGALVEAVALPWREIVALIEKNPDFLNQVPWRRVEELIAGAYKREGWEEVTLTTRSADGGRDIIAVTHRPCAIRVIDQVKAYSPGHRVSANDVRALLGVLSSDLNVSKGFVTTTADFAPGILEDRSIVPFLPYRLELKNGVRLRSWLLEVAAQFR